MAAIRARRRARRNSSPDDFSKNVFVNCPFDKDYLSLLRPLLFTVVYSVFTVHPDPTAAFAHPGLRMWTISQEACRDLKVVLDSCSINYASMFPDLQGLARHVGWRYKWGMPQGYGV